MSTNEHFLTSAFKRLINKGRLGHGYLIFGEDRDVQRDFALSLLGFLETKKWGAFDGTLVDGMYITKDEEGTISINVVHEAIRFLWQTPFTSPRRTVIIEEADCMGHEAQQALLKTAEEPPRNGLVMLLVRNPESLFPTLTSRLQKIYVPRAGIKYLVSSIKYENEETKRAKEYVAEFLGSDSRGKSQVLKSLMEEENNALLDAFGEELLYFLAKDPAANWKALKELLKRISAMGQFTTNRKLQFEAVIPFLEQ